MARGWGLVKFEPQKDPTKYPDRKAWLEALQKWAEDKGWQAFDVQRARGITSMDALVAIEGLSKQEIEAKFDQIEATFSHVEGYTA